VPEGTDSIQALLADLLNEIRGLHMDMMSEVRGLRMDMASVFEALLTLVQTVQGDSARAISEGFSEYVRLNKLGLADWSPEGVYHDDEGT
jgi:hypothetical protein